MGQNSSMRSRIALQLEIAIAKLESHRMNLKEVASLKKETFQNLITELNKAVAGITDAKGCRLQFNVVAGSMDGRNWKSTVRVDCWKIDAMTTSVSSHCRFSLRHFQKLYEELMLLAAKATCTADCHKLKYIESRHDEAGGNAASSSGVGESNDDDVEAGPADELCSLCQEFSTDITLSCGHCYCQTCLDKWLHVAERKSGANQPSGSAADGNGGDCPLCKPSKQYESLLNGRPLHNGAKLRVKVSPEMADELMSIPERIRAEFVAKRKLKASHRSGAQKLASKLAALRQMSSAKHKSATVSGIQRLPPAHSESDLQNAVFASDDDDDDDDYGEQDSPSVAGVSRSLALTNVSGSSSAGNPAKKEGAFAKAKQLFRFGRSNTTETGDTDNLLSISTPANSRGHNRK